MSIFGISMHRKYIKLRINKPMFSPVVLEITRCIYKEDISFSFKHVVSMYSMNTNKASLFLTVVLPLYY